MKKTALLSLVLLTSCSFVPEYLRPAPDVPPAWTMTSPDDSVSVAQDWWKTFASAELDGLINDALANNNDLKAGVQRIEQARALRAISRASLLPSADYSGSIGREKTTRPDDSGTRIGAGAGVSYELDLFGANRAETAAAEAELAATQYDYEALKLLVMADVAQTYFDVLNARERLRIADSNLKNSGEVLRIVDARFEAGASDALEVAQQKADLATSEAARATVEQSIKNAENALAVLVGKPPQSITVAGKNLQDVKVPVIALGQPSNLLERRPDIRASEADLQAANADIGAARAAFFPTLTLGLDGSLAKTGFGDPTSTVLGLTAGVLGPIFRGGAIQAGVDQATAREKELAENYRKTVLTSFREVEDALAAVKASSVRETALATAMQEARRSYELSRTRYDAGTIDFQTLLDSQRILLESEDAFATSKNERLSAAVTLFRALGGGWSSGSSE